MFRCLIIRLFKIKKLTRHKFDSQAVKNFRKQKKILISVRIQNVVQICILTFNGKKIIVSRNIRVSIFFESIKL